MQNESESVLKITGSLIFSTMAQPTQRSQFGRIPALSHQCKAATMWPQQRSQKFALPDRQSGPDSSHDPCGVPLAQDAATAPAVIWEAEMTFTMKLGYVATCLAFVFVGAITVGLI
jgi:hypothetical protein